MLPFGHAATAYLCYAVYAVVTSRRLPARLALFPLALGSQFPDLIDKPLAYWNLVPYGRSLAHSVFTCGLVIALIWGSFHYARDYWDPGSWQDRLRVVTPAAFGIGYTSHLLGDSYTALLAGRFVDARFLLYPLYPLPESPADDIPPWLRLLRIYQYLDTHPQFGLIIFAVVVFLGIRIWASVKPRLER
ncbi:metal-dependent hydrolase [Halobellus sp. EA9]|uniref:metal-dependent hydrolase n=1 Tax=Halobellus sp. EA9 TaxID=3421647 RepID=UPI003EBE9FFA